MKAALALLLVVCAASFALPDSPMAMRGRYLLLGILIVHAVECAVFLPRLRAAGGSLSHHLVQTLLFGILHVRTLPRA